MKFTHYWSRLLRRTCLSAIASLMLLSSPGITAENDAVSRPEPSKIWSGSLNIYQWATAEEVSRACKGVSNRGCYYEYASHTREDKRHVIHIREIEDWCDTTGLWALGHEVTHALGYSHDAEHTITRPYSKGCKLGELVRVRP